jgi:asparagine synthase (glutamine-hydrolysing)
VTAILGYFGEGVGGEAEGRFIARLHGRGADTVGVRRPQSALLIVTRHDWESELDGPDSASVVDGGGVSLVADASIYYRDDLSASLRTRGVELRTDSSASRAILAAYRAWGEEAPRMLEGDFAFVLWDREGRRAVCARDFGGKRPLYYATSGRNLIVASSVGAVVAAPGFVPRLNLAVLAETCAQFWSGSDETCYHGVRELPAGATLTWSPGDQPTLARHWDVPNVGTARSSRLDEDAEELRRLLVRSTRERLARRTATAVWMSGGWDSSSVFAAARAAVRESGEPNRVVTPVSISYPQGDPGREDELISSIAAHWKSPVHWLDVDRIPLLGDAEAGAAERDVPFAHTYEHWNRALAHGARAVGARVAFDGNGGDQLFQISNVFMADLLRAGRLRAVAKQWREKGGRGAGTFLDWVIAPALPALVKPHLMSLLGRRSADDFTRPTPAWIRKDFVKRHELIGRERRQMPKRAGYRGWRREAHFFLAAPAFPRAFQTLAGFALDAGVELRSPLFDRRVIEFACARPREERNDGRETKRLVRAAMRGLLPDEVLAPRSRRTGITTAYSDRRMRAEFPLLLERHSKMQMLAELGIVEPEPMRRSWEEYCRTGSTALKIPLFLTMQVELWLRGHARRESFVDSTVKARETSYAQQD